MRWCGQQEQVPKRLSRRRWWLAVPRQLHATIAVVQGDRAAAAAATDDDNGAEKDTLPVDEKQADAAAGGDTQSQPIVASAGLPMHRGLLPPLVGRDMTVSLSQTAHRKQTRMTLRMHTGHRNRALAVASTQEQEMHRGPLLPRMANRHTRDTGQAR